MSSNHFACIGLFDGDLQESLERLAPLLEQADDDVPPAPPFRHRLWTDASGAAIAVHTRADSVECITPWFAPEGGATRLRVRTTAVARDPECMHCSGADVDLIDERGEMVTRACVQWLHFQPWQRLLGEPRELELEVVAFANEASFFATPEEFEAAQAGWFDSDGKGTPQDPQGRPLRFAENAFVPIGMFADHAESMTERATVMLGGRVESIEHREVEPLGSAFQQVRVRALPGPIDVLLEPGSCEGEPKVGHIAWVQAWLVGRPTAQPMAVSHPLRPGTRRSWWARLSRKKG